MLDDLLQFVSPTSRKAYIGLLQHVPVHVRTICTVGESGCALGYVMKKRPGTRAYGILADESHRAVAGQMVDAVATLPEAASVVPLPDVGAVLTCNLERSAAINLATLAELTPSLSNSAYVFALFADPALVAEGGGPTHEGLRDTLATELAGMGYRIHAQWGLDSTKATLVMAVREDYDPLEHARMLSSRAAYPDAWEVVDQAPRDESVSADRRVLVHWARLELLAQWLEADPDASDRGNKLMAAQESFYYVSYALPGDPAAFLAMARCWRAAGDTNLARRLLRSAAEAIGDEARFAEAEQIAPALRSVTPVLAPRWEGGNPPRVLFLMNPRPHYGIDVLYDGLCACLGDAQVVDYPYKPWLHGEETDQLKHYPCRFDRRGRRRTFEDIRAGAENGAFDFVLYADIEGALPRDEMSAIVTRASCPVAIVDGLDEFMNFRERVESHLQFDGFVAYFKREKLRTLDYGPASYPLPFAYDGEKAVEKPAAHRSRECFWAGHRMFGMRRLYLENLEKRYGWDLNKGYPPEEYIAAIRDAQLGLNFFGMGFDTVRYWEVPAQGALLLSERLPIEIPHDFEDGLSAAFFEDLPSLHERLDYFLAHPDEAQSIAEAGHAHFRAHHTNEARARQLLGWLTRENRHL